MHPNIKLGLGYALINGYGANSGLFKNPRHRLMADVTGTIHYGNWNFSLKERFQVTRRTGDFNIYQNPQNALTLKSRVKALYKGLGKVQPYAYFEVRNYLNAPVIEADAVMCGKLRATIRADDLTVNAVGEYGAVEGESKANDLTAGDGDQLSAPGLVVLSDEGGLTDSAADFKRLDEFRLHDYIAPYFRLRPLCGADLTRQS